jgi:hypothetical protein
MNEALESATSLPDPTAIETSAAAIAYTPTRISFVKNAMNAFARTGASFMPSPTIAIIQRLFNLFPNSFPSLDRRFFGAFS